MNDDGGHLIPSSLRPMMEEAARNVVLPEERAVQWAMAELAERVRALPEPTLGKKGGVNRQAVLDMIEEAMR